MSIKNMHYDLKVKLNRVDTNAYANIQIPEIDRKMNEAMILYILLVAEPRLKNQLGFETSQRSIDDLSPIVRDNIELTVHAPSSPGEPTIYTAILPDEYMYYLSTNILRITSGDCENQLFETTVIRHNDQNERRDFYKSDFNWREMNIRFNSAGIRLYNPEDWTIEKFSIDYLKQPDYIHNAEDFAAGSYNLPDGTALTGYQDCPLPVHTHKEIVDLAAMLITGDLEMPLASQFKQNLLRTKQLL